MQVDDLAAPLLSFASFSLYQSIPDVLFKSGLGVSMRVAQGVR